MTETGRIIVVSAPSGAGKSTLLGMVRRELLHLSVTVSATTRPPRPGEVEAKDYYFTSREQFLEDITAGRFAEWAEVHGHLYGTHKSEIERRLLAGGTVVLELDVQGMRSIKRLYPQMCSIFIVPPDLDTLKKRLVLRGVNTPTDMEVRLKNARNEMAAIAEFDHCVVNDDLDVAAKALVKIIEGSAFSEDACGIKLK